MGTEIHLVNRMGKEFAKDNKMVVSLDDSGCLCTTMFRISPQHLCWALENLVEGNVVNRIKVGRSQALVQGGVGSDAGDSVSFYPPPSNDS